MEIQKYMSMNKLKAKILRFWYFKFNNPVIRKGEHGGFRWQFNRYYFTIETISGNWKARWTASEFPFGYLLNSKDDDNIEGFAATMYMLGMLLTRDQGLVNDVQRAIRKYDQRLQKQEASKMKEEDRQDEIALEAVKQEQEFVELPKKEQRKVEREVNGRFKKVVKDAGKAKKE